MCSPEMDVFVGAGVDGWMWTAAQLDLDGEFIEDTSNNFGYLNGESQILHEDDFSVKGPGVDYASLWH